MDIDLPTAVRAEFGCENERVRPFDGGLVNFSFAVGEPTRLVIQGINDRYLSDPNQVMENLVRILGHLDWHRALRRPNERRWYPTVVPTQSGRPYTVDDHGRVWRALQYIDASPVSIDASWPTIEGAASLFGRYLGALDDFGAPPLGAVVPAFRSTARIVEDFHQTATEAGSLPAGVDKLRERAQRLTDLVNDIDREVAAGGPVPTRVVHNDPKLANCLVDRSGAAVAIIDFDLAMTGYAMDDFGDLVRSACHYRRDHDPLEVAARIAPPFIAGSGDVLDDTEVMSLAHGPLRVCVQLAWRYLADTIRPVPLLRVGGVDAALQKAATNLDVAERFAGNQAQLRAVIRHAVDTA